MGTPTENKVQFNLKNVYYAKKTGDSTWATPKPVPGAVSVALKPEGELKKFYADGLVYYRSSANNGYSGDIEFARIPDSMRSDIWGMTEDSNNVIVENANTESASFALMFEIDGDADEELYCLYDVSAERPSIASKTNEETKEPQTTSLALTAIPLTDGKVFARTTASTSAAVKAAWNTTVYTGTAAGNT